MDSPDLSRYPCNPFLPGLAPGCSFRQSLTLPAVECRLGALPNLSSAVEGPRRQIGPHSGRSPWSKPHSQVRPALHPVAAISLSVALWKESAVVPTPAVPQPRTGALGWTSLRRDPGAWLTCKTLCSLGGAMAKSLQRAIRRLPAFFLTVLLQKAAYPARGLAAFAFLNASESENVPLS